MYRTRLITGFILGLAFIGVAATYYPGGLGRFYGDSAITTLVTGAVYWRTDTSTLYIGSGSSNPVAVASLSAYSNAVGSATLTVLSNATLAVTNETQIATVGACTVTLPAASAGRVVGIVKRDDGTLLTVNGGTIENDAQGARITTRFSAEFLCDGSKWWIQ